MICCVRLERGTWQLPDNREKNNPQHVLVHRVEESPRAANRRRDNRESRRRLAITPAGTATAASPPDPCNFALRRLVGNFAARNCWRERLRRSLYFHGAATPIAATLGLTFRISAQQGPLILPRLPHSRHPHPNDYCDEQITPLCSTLTVGLLTELAVRC